MHTPLSLLLCGLALLLHSSFDEDALRLAWKTQAERLPVAYYEIEGEIVYTPAFLAGLPAVSRDLTPTPIPVKITCALDVTHQRFKVVRKEKIWHVPSGKLQSYENVVLVEADKAREFISFPDLKDTRSKDSDPRRALAAETLPVLSNSGFGYSLFVNPSRGVFAKDSAAYKDLVWTATSSKWLRSRGEAQVYVRSARSSVLQRLLIDVDSGYQIIGLTSSLHGARIATMWFHYRVVQGRRIATRWQMDFWSTNGKLVKHVDLKVIKCETVLPREFRWSLPSEQ